ncbi:MAG TPA: LytTR family DNA-binding domain-containing protein [Puia sp.]|uniref:LytR/AlgR family response regulator transcription factor n=1 Tax=Puia sp. TaxID=2045100 RepID=UPI002B545465|nr:LytTR family DNA-binding domain-containing protein [Puia sp.]HVU97824.1 LytTR family DNA-binding domain-containing protein [Puia sp.]
MSITAVLIDDEQNNLDNLDRLLTQYCPEVEVIGSATNASTGRQLIATQHPELVFLDIQMPGETGLQLLQQLPSLDFQLIFVTAYDQYGIQAVKFAAVDYLLKPIDPRELQEAVHKAMLRHGERSRNAQLENLLQLLQRQPFKEEHRIALTTLKETRFLQTRQIIRCESDNNYCYFFLDNSEKILVSKPIYEFEPLLKDYGFIRCHQSHLVNLQHIRSWIREDGGYLLLNNGDTVPVSRGKKEAVLQALGF